LERRAFPAARWSDTLKSSHDDVPAMCVAARLQRTRSMRTMHIRRADAMEGKPVAMEGVKGVTMRLLVGREHGAPTFSMRHFTVEPGGHTPRHSHNYEHEVLVLEGTGRVEHDGAFHALRHGDVLFIEPNKVHQFVNTGDAPFKFICLVPSSFDCGGGERAATPGS
jgi:quercetin dioxygenase-like cupin family protein